MSRHILRLGFILVAVSLMTGSCGRKNDLPDDPLEALAAINQNAKEIKSAHFTGSVIGIIESEGKTENAGMIIDGDMVIKDGSKHIANMQMTVSALLSGQITTVGMIVLDGKYWARYGSESWNQAPAELSPPMGNVDVPFVVIQYLEQAKNVKRLNDEIFNGVDCLHYGFTIDLKSLAEQSMPTPAVNAGQQSDSLVKEFVESGEVTSEVWADKEHLFLRRQIIRVETLADNLPESEADTLKIQAQMDWQYSKINEPIEIKAPQN